VEALRKKLGTPEPRELGEAADDELKKAQESVKQLRRLLPAKELGEAKKETERAASALKRLRKALDDKNAMRKQGSPQMDQFAGEMGEASKLAQELQQELEKLVPRPEDAMSQGQRERGQSLGQRQGSLEQRAQQLAEELNKKASQVPGADKAGGELKQIGQQMGEAGGDLQRGSAHEGAGKAQEAADRLAKLRDQMGQRQMGGNQSQREPVRIPGADESKAPREWRQELLEAMRERAPERFREEVRRYYEELVK
jgi:chromosome segregation ATPase